VGACVVAKMRPPDRAPLDAPIGAPRLRALTTSRVAEIGRRIDLVLTEPEGRAELRDLVSLLAARHSEGLARIVEMAAPVEVPRNLTVAEAARIMGVEARWIYDHAHELESTRRVGRYLRFDSVVIQRDRARRG
jgi:putative cofactor-binding repeat protein